MTIFGNHIFSIWRLEKNFIRQLAPAKKSLFQTLAKKKVSFARLKGCKADQPLFCHDIFKISSRKVLGIRAEITRKEWCWFETAVIRPDISIWHFYKSSINKYVYQLGGWLMVSALTQELQAV